MSIFRCDYCIRGIHELTLFFKIDKAVISYRLARVALKALRSDKMKLYERLDDSDLTLNKDVTEENRVNQRSDLVPWFWLIRAGRKETSSVWLKECKLITFENNSHSWHLSSVHRVMWLRAKQRRDRWDEEVQQCAADFAMIVNWFSYQVTQWKDKAKNAEVKGRRRLACYALRKAAMFMEFWRKARTHEPAIKKYFQQIWE